MNSIPRWLTALFVAVALILVAGGTWLYQSEKEHLRLRINGNLKAIAQLKADQIAQWRAERLGDALELMGNPLLVAGVTKWTKDHGAESAEAILPYPQAIRLPIYYSDLLLVNPAGRILLSRSSQSGVLHEDARQALHKALQSGQPVLSDLHAGGGDLPIHIDAVAPLFEPGVTPPRPIGAYLLRFDASRFLFPLIETWPTTDQGSETLLVRRDGMTVLILNELRYRRGTALQLRFPLSRQELPAVRAVLGQEEVMEGVDYRGVAVFYAFKAVPESPWFIVVKIDQAEALAGWNLDAALILALVVVLLTAAAAALGAVWQRNAKAHYRLLFQAETARRESEARYRTMLMSVGDGVIATDAEGRVVLLNRVAETLTGWTRAEAQGKLFSEVFQLVSEETRRPTGDPVKEVLRHGLIIGLADKSLLIARDGSAHPISDSCAPIKDETGRISGAIFVFHDQSAERLTRTALEALNSRQQALLAAIPDIIMEVDANKIYTWANQAGLDFFGGDVIGREAADFFEGAQQTYDMVRPLFNGAENVIYLESWQRRRDGQRRLLAWWCRVLKNEEGKVVGALSSARDITEQKRAEQEKERLQEQLLQFQKLESIGLLAGGVAHDFNNMLQVILGYADLALSEVEASQPLHEYLSEIQKAAQRSGKLTSQLLAFARKQPACPLLLDLNDFVPATLNMLRRLIGEEIELVWKPGPDLWTVLIDPSQVDQLLTNLAINAREAIAGHGVIHIETTNAEVDETYRAIHPEAVAGEYVRITVSDSGRGMDKEILSRCLEPFFSTKGVGQGVGLGLATVYGIVKQNGGFLSLYSEPGHGTIFRIFLPRAQAEATPLPVSSQETGSVGGSETILMVEDEIAILRQSQENLRQLGYTVLTAHSPTEALQLASAHAGPIHLLLTDVVLPEMNGLELSQRLIAARPGLKCLFMSGYTADIIAHEGVLDPGVCFIQKPFSIKSLAAKVRETLDN